MCVSVEVELVLESVVSCAYIYIYIYIYTYIYYLYIKNKLDSKNRLFYHFHPSANDFIGNIWHIHKHVAHQRNIYWWSHHIQGWEFPSIGFATGRDMYMPLPNQFAILPDLFIISHALPFCQSPVNSSWFCRTQHTDALAGFDIWHHWLRTSYAKSH